MKRAHYQPEPGQDPSPTSLTSSQAASLLKVHESSIKRWSNQGELRYSKTEGGHRRFDIADLLTFASQRGKDFPLGSFGSDQYALCEALYHFWQSGHLHEMLKIASSWLESPQRLKLPALFSVLYKEYEVPLDILCDDLICAVMGVVGDAWQQGRLQVGQEHLISQTVMDGLQVLREDISQRRKQARGNTQRAPMVAISSGAEGSHHELGAFCIRLILEEQGWQTLYTGPNLPAIELAMLQQEYEARLVCISFVKPLRLSDVYRNLHSLVQLYRKDFPFAIAAGGSALSELGDSEHVIEELFATGGPFEALAHFRTIREFRAWLKSHQADFKES